MITEAAEDVVVQAARTDDRPRRRRLAGPVAAIAGVGLTAGLLFAVDPNRPGVYPVCPTQLLFGVDCPACGGLRGTHALVHGDVATALDHNVLLPLAVVTLVVFGVRWFRQAWRGEVPAVTARQSRQRTVTLIVVMVVLIAFGVVRNFVPYLSSAA